MGADTGDPLNEYPLCSEGVFDGVLLKVFRDRVRLPDGGESVREYVRHPGATHEITRSGDNRQRMDQMLRTYEFFERWMR